MKGAACRFTVLVSRNQLPVQVYVKHYCFSVITYFGFLALNFVLFRHSSGVLMAPLRIRYYLEDWHLADAWFRQARRPHIQKAADRRDSPGFVHRGLHVVLPNVLWSNVLLPS